MENKSVRYYKPLTAHQVKSSLNEGRPEEKFARDTKSIDTKSAYTLKLALRYGSVPVVYQSTRQMVKNCFLLCSTPACVYRFLHRVEMAFRKNRYLVVFTKKRPSISSMKRSGWRT